MPNESGAKLDILQGTLDLMVLQTLSHHGAAAWIPDRGPAGTGVDWNAAPQYGDPVPGADAPGAAPIRAGRLGRHGQQSQGAVSTASPRPAAASSLPKNPRGTAWYRSCSWCLGNSSESRPSAKWMMRLAGVFGRGRTDRDLDQEIQTHLELAEEDFRRQGMSPDQAAREARLRLGQSTQTLETLRDKRGFPPLSAFALDVKLGLRMLRKQWGLTLMGGLAMTIAITIGASFFDLLQVLTGTTLPLPEGDRVVVIQPLEPGYASPRINVDRRLHTMARRVTIRRGRRRVPDDQAEFDR